VLRGSHQARGDPSRLVSSVRLRRPARAQTPVGRPRAAVPVTVGPDRYRAAASEGGVRGVRESTGPRARRPCGSCRAPWAGSIGGCPLLGSRDTDSDAEGDCDHFDGLEGVRGADRIGPRRAKLSGASLIGQCISRVDTILHKENVTALHWPGPCRACGLATGLSEPEGAEGGGALEQAAVGRAAGGSRA
jgi:hypothetical protein